MRGKWIRIADVAEVPEDGTFRVYHEGEPVCLYNVAGVIYATHDVCTHGQASLADGFVDGEEIECPLHGAKFHIPTGKCTKEPGARDLACYAVRLEGGRLFVKVD
jgi:3-phenylpropionate/trans-cinnamate dioxygenase ferredoxin subunit